MFVPVFDLLPLQAVRVSIKPTIKAEANIFLSIVISPFPKK